MNPETWNPALTKFATVLAVPTFSTLTYLLQEKVARLLQMAQRVGDQGLVGVATCNGAGTRRVILITLQLGGNDGVNAPIDCLVLGARHVRRT